MKTKFPPFLRAFVWPDTPKALQADLFMLLATHTDEQAQVWLDKIGYKVSLQMLDQYRIKYGINRDFSPDVDQARRRLNEIVEKHPGLTKDEQGSIADALFNAFALARFWQDQAKNKAAAEEAAEAAEPTPGPRRSRKTKSQEPRPLATAQVTQAVKEITNGELEANEIVDEIRRRLFGKLPHEKA